MQGRNDAAMDFTNLRNYLFSSALDWQDKRMETMNQCLWIKHLSF